MTRELTEIFTQTMTVTTPEGWAEYGLVACGYPVGYTEPPAPNPQQPAAPQWRAPIDDPAQWYCAVWHDPTGVKNGVYKHTGIDLNLAKAPFGDVERGFPVYSIGAGVVEAVHTTAGWLGFTVIRHEFEGAPLYTRYAHLDSMPLKAGDVVAPGALVGKIANWQGGDGGDHLHFDMSALPYPWGVWLTGGGWLDPVPVLEKMLGVDAVRAMLEK